MTRAPPRFLVLCQLGLQRVLVEGEFCVFDAAELETADAPNILIGADGASEFRMPLATLDSWLQRVPIAAIWS